MSGIRKLLHHLAADFAARIGRGVDVDVVLAGHEVGCLGVGQGGAAFDRARGGIGDRNRDAGVRAGCGRTVEVRGRRRTGKPRIGQFPAQLLAGGIVFKVGGALAGGRVGGNLGTCRRELPSSCRRPVLTRRRQGPRRAQA